MNSTVQQKRSNEQLQDVHRIRQVFVPLDGTTRATVALPVAKAITEIESAKLHVVHVGMRVSAPRDRVEELHLTSEQFRGAILEQATGDPVESILSMARQPGSVIVMCTHTGIEKARGELGSVARNILCNAPCPVVLVQPERGQAAFKIDRVLLPHDGTPTSAIGIGTAAHWAHRAGSELLVLHVSAGPNARQSSEAGTFSAPRYVDQAHHEWPAWVQEFVTRLEGIGHPPAGVKLRLFAVAGNPGAEIVRFAHEHSADLVVMTWLGCWEAERAMTMKEVIQKSGCPVVLLKASASVDSP